MTALERYSDRSTELALTDPTGGRLVAWAEAARSAAALATSLTKTTFAPKDFRGKPEEATAAILLGDELGLSPLSALRSVYVISGTPALYARTMVALAMAHGHDVWTESSTDREVVVCGRRKGSEHTERAVWTIDRARKAGYTSNRKYDTDPQGMLYSKAAAEIARKVAPDVLSGVPYSVEDLELEQPEPSTHVKRSSTRQRAAAPVAPEPEFDEPQSAPEPVATVLPVDPPEQGGDGISQAQSRKLHALLRECGISDREAGLSYIGNIIDREIGSTKELTKAEASTAIDQIEREKEPTDAEADWPEPTLPGADQ